MIIFAGLERDCTTTEEQSMDDDDVVFVIIMGTDDRCAAQLGSLFIHACDNHAKK